MFGLVIRVDGINKTDTFLFFQYNTCFFEFQKWSILVILKKQKSAGFVDADH